MKTPLRTFRLVCDPRDAAKVEGLLREQGFDFEPEPFFGMARVLTREPFPLGESLAARFGLVYIQDRSSMLPPLLLDPPAGATVLDMCAAPGSKTGLLARLVGREGFVLGCEPSPDRLGTLRANLRRANAANAATVRGQSQDLPFANGTWEYIQLDPPCSGWGTVDKNPRVMELWGEGKTAPLVKLQRQLLEKAASMLVPGGSVLFSTCTTNMEENEEQVAWALENLDLELEPLAPPPGFVFGEPMLSGMDGVLRVAAESEGQGFFLARFRKRGGDVFESGGDMPELPGRALRLDRAAGPAQMDLGALPPGTAYDFNGKVFWLHERALEIMPEGLKWQGFPLGRIAGKGAKATFRPDPGTRILLPGKPGPDCLDVSDTEILTGFLSGRSLGFGSGKGPVGLYWRGLPLGWLSRKGSRVLWSGK